MANNIKPRRAKTFIGDKCDKCGCTERYSVDGRCVSCQLVRAEKRRQKERSLKEVVIRIDYSVDGVISRDDAIASGLKTYFTGVMCKNGHVDRRSVIGRSCLSCKKEYDSRDVVLKKKREREKNRRESMSPEQIEKLRDYDRMYAVKNADRRIKYRKDNAERIRKKSNEWYKKKKDADPEFKMACWCRITINKMIKSRGASLSRGTFKALGYTAAELKDNIESKFSDGIGWHNRDYWHIDHICPISKLIDNGVTDVSIINHLDNLRPIPASENIEKSDKIIDYELFDRLVRMSKAIM